MAHPTEKTLQAAAFTYTRREWKVLDDSIKTDLDYLQSVSNGEATVTSRSLNDKHWIVAYVLDNGPVRYYDYDREAHKARFLFTNRKDVQELPDYLRKGVTIPFAKDFDQVYRWAFGQQE